MSLFQKGIRFLQADAQVFRTMMQRQSRRRVTTSAETAASAEQQSAFAKIWNSEVGPKTVHFWAPVFKWGVFLTTVSDFTRPASQLSITQNVALAATGAIWTRWCFVIKPRNIGLASVNACLFFAAATQVFRAISYQQSVKNEGLAGELKQEVKKDGEIAKDIAENPEKAAQKATA